MLHQQPRAAAQPQSKLILQQARTQSEIAEAQALRYRVFIEEMGARIASRVEGVDRDMFDPYCDHLIVRDSASFDVVGTYRILPPAQARRIGGFYADEEFDLTRLANLRHELVELGRSCVHPDYRNGATIALLWNGIAQYLQANNYRYLIGCASVSLNDGGAGAVAVYRQVREKHLGPIEWRVFPRCPLPTEMLDNDSGGQASERRPIPPLIKGYLRAGAYVCGDPAWDPDFNTADLFMLLPIANLSERHAARFMGG
jgi:putative hemolysin